MSIIISCKASDPNLALTDMKSSKFFKGIILNCSIMIIYSINILFFMKVL